MRISDWSSDVCSSDLLLGLDNQPLDLLGELVGIAHRAPRPIRKRDRPYLLISVEDFVAGLSGYPERPAHLCHALAVRSEERRVGKECVSTCRSRWSPSH